MVNRATTFEGGVVAGAHRLAVLRHAKATHELGHRDIKRPLTQRGQRDAAAAGRFLRSEGIVPDLVVCSNSSRTSETWDYLVADAWAAGTAGTGTAGTGTAGTGTAGTGTAGTGTAGTGARGAGATGAATATEVSYDQRIYDAGLEDLFEIIRETPASIGTLMIIGHNPAVHELVLALTGDRHIEFPTCALAVIDLAVDWAETSAADGRLARFWTPKGNAR